MRLSKLSKTRIAAMSISAAANIRAFNAMTQFHSIEENIEEYKSEDFSVGEIVWNELSTMGLKEKTRDSLARCFEAITGAKIAPSIYVQLQIGSLVFDSNCRYKFAAVVPTKNTNGHNYDIGRACIINASALRSGLLRTNGGTGNTINILNIAFPTPENLFDFFDINGRSFLPITNINIFYGASTIRNAMDDIDNCMKTIAEYESVVDRILRVNNFAKKEIIMVR